MPRNVLFLCTGNSARSIMAEALLNYRAGDRYRAFSAGSQPKGVVHPLAIETLQRHHIPIGDLRSKRWNEFATATAPAMDFVFTVCDNAAQEVCPVWPGQPISAHWGVADPAAVEGSEDDRRRAFSKALRELDTRIQLFNSLPMERLDRIAVKRAVESIGHTVEEPPR